MILKNGWQVKKRKVISDLQTVQRERMIDFSIENPANSKLKALPVIEELLKIPIVNRKVTSYCQYGTLYRKNTAIITSVQTFNPMSKCPDPPCPALQKGEKHIEGVQGQDLRTKYNIPPRLIQELVSSFMHKYPRAKRFLVIDCFAGFGSIKAAVESMKTARPIAVFCNDKVARCGVDLTLDLSSGLNLHLLFPFAVLSAYGDNSQERDLIMRSESSFEYLKHTETAVLVHASIPCQTYSTASGSTHRASGSTDPLTSTAERHDLITSHICEWIHANILKL